MTVERKKRRNKVFKISRATATKVSGISQLVFEKFGEWIPAGSGNFEKITTEGNYRDNCNKPRMNLTCEHGHSKNKLIFQHCSKMDCAVCFVTSSSSKARIMDRRFKAFQRLCYINQIRIGKIVHFSIMLDKKREEFRTYDGYRKYKSKVLLPMIKDMGIVGGACLLHVWSNYCTSCEQEHKNCTCMEGEAELVRQINLHVHVVGYGFLMNAREFKDKYPEIVYRNHLPRRSDAFYTVFYVLSKASLWRKPDGKLKPSSSYFGWLHGRKFGKFNEQKEIRTDNCPECHEPRIIESIEDEKLKHRVVYKIQVKKASYQIRNMEALRDIVDKSRTATEPTPPDTSKKEEFLKVSTEGGA